MFGRKIYGSNMGFTLVELMVVVAIIGILSAIAIPNFKTYQAKAKTSEAKIQLASIYQAEISLQSDFDSFATCLGDAGYVAPKDNYYALGFPAAGGGIAIVTSNGGTCTNTNFGFPASKKVGSSPPMTATDLSSVAAPSPAFANGLTTVGVKADGSGFFAGAIGNIDTAKTGVALNDQWGIDENKALKNTRKGY